MTAWVEGTGVALASVDEAGQPMAGKQEMARIVDAVGADTRMKFDMA